MGIKGLMKFLQECAPKAVKEMPGPESYTGRAIAIDASMCLYQFIIMIRENRSGSYQNLTNEDGEITSHIIGFLTRTIRLMESGIKPVYVFDGKPPELKLEELQARREKREVAKKAMAEAQEAGDGEAVLKAAKQTVKVTKEHNEQTKELLRLMGVPVVDAPSEAEATCAALCSAGKVYASSTEDADCLTFGTTRLIRNLMAAESQKKTIFEVELAVALEQLGVSMDQFIDFCILCGCDYCDTLKVVGPSTAIKLIMQHGSIEKILEEIDAEKTPVPANFRYQIARDLFKECEAVPMEGLNFEWKDPDVEGLKKFLIEGNSFHPDRVDRLLGRLAAAKNRTKQRPLSSFFGQPKTVIKESDKFDPTKKKGQAKKSAEAKKRAGGPAGGPAKRAR